ncbi:hypothetical protein VNO77_23984 [Canavalia gladiata]|uniref:Uncharacterized protein n=1 Tax=Canavalia gladiata TaxID=3824 RepID=A0AAN9L5W9_CANGL
MSERVECGQPSQTLLSAVCVCERETTTLTLLLLPLAAASFSLRFTHSFIICKSTSGVYLGFLMQLDLCVRTTHFFNSNSQLHPSATVVVCQVLLNFTLPFMFL